jgi:hypothetical protein
MLIDQRPRTAASPAYFLGRPAESWRVALDRHRRRPSAPNE